MMMNDDWIGTIGLSPLVGFPESQLYRGIYAECRRLIRPETVRFPLLLESRGHYSASQTKVLDR